MRTRDDTHPTHPDAADARTVRRAGTRFAVEHFEAAARGEGAWHDAAEGGWGQA